MKRIRVNHITRLDVSPGHDICTDDVRELSSEARRNKLEILEGALTVEAYLAKMISHFFFRPDGDKKLIFDEIVINSDWCSFSAKRKLFSYIINRENLLQGADKERFDKCLRKVMSFRNAFAHGKLSSNGKVVWLSYFEGGNHKQELTDQYLAAVESELKSACNQCFELAQKMGAVSV